MAERSTRYENDVDNSRCSTAVNESHLGSATGRLPERFSRSGREGDATPDPSTGRLRDLGVKNEPRAVGSGRGVPAGAGSGTHVDCGCLSARLHGLVQSTASWCVRSPARRDPRVFGPHVSPPGASTHIDAKYTTRCWRRQCDVTIDRSAQWMNIAGCHRSRSRPKRRSRGMNADSFVMCSGPNAGPRPPEKQSR
jgi:hypothetical protein